MAQQLHRSLAANMWADTEDGSSGTTWLELVIAFDSSGHRTIDYDNALAKVDIEGAGKRSMRRRKARQAMRTKNGEAAKAADTDKTLATATPSMPPGHRARDIQEDLQKISKRGGVVPGKKNVPPLQTEQGQENGRIGHPRPTSSDCRLQGADSTAAH